MEVDGERERKQELHVQIERERKSERDKEIFINCFGPTRMIREIFVVFFSLKAFSRSLNHNFE